jgi:archaellum component FlaG (FlaF/FlaG flagellin family)
MTTFRIRTSSLRVLAHATVLLVGVAVMLAPIAVSAATQATDESTPPRSLLDAVSPEADPPGQRFLAATLLEIANDEGLDPEQRALAAARAGVDHRLGLVGSELDESLRPLLEQQHRNLDTAERLTAMLRNDPAGGLANGVEIAKVATEHQAATMGLDPGAVEIELPEHDSPREAAEALVAGLGGQIGDAERSQLAELDAIREPTASALARVIDAFSAFAHANEMAFANADMEHLKEIADRLEAGDAEGVYRDEGLKSPHDVKDKLGIDLAPVFVARGFLLDAVLELHDALVEDPEPVPASSQSTAAPIGLAPYLGVELSTTNANTYSQDFWLLIDAGGNDTYNNNAGGGTTRWSTTSAIAAAALVDLGGSDLYRGRTGPETGGDIGAGWIGNGFLLDAGGSDTFNPDASNNGKTGAGVLGSGFLMATSGGTGQIFGTNTYTFRNLNFYGQPSLIGGHGGAALGAGTLIDTWIADGFTASTSRTADPGSAMNGGGQLPGAGFLLSALGDATYSAAGHGANGGAHLGGSGLLLDGAGNDDFIAGSVGSNGGSYAGVGFLFDALGADTFDARSDGTNGGGAIGGVGLLVDSQGSDTYLAQARGTNGGGGVVPSIVGGAGGAGFLVDGGGSNSYSAHDIGTNGGAELGTGLMVDLATSGTTAYTARGDGTNGGGWAGVGFLLDAGGSDTYTARTRATNGGGVFAGSGALIDAGGSDTYRADVLGEGANGVNGGGSLGTGVLFDGGGTDTYRESGGTTFTNQNVAPKGTVGAQIDHPHPLIPTTTLPTTTLPTVTTSSTTTSTLPPTTLPPNNPPSVTLLSPTSGHVFDRDEPQVFTVRATDPQGDPSRATVLVDGQSVCQTPVALSGNQTSCVAAPPVAPGAHSWSAFATDIRGAQGGQAVARSFSVSANAAPDVPVLVSPNPGGGFERDEPQVFTVTYSDPDADAGSVEVFVDADVVCRTAPVPSGATSSCVAAPPVEPGAYSWTARSVDVHGAESDFAPARVFTVGGNRAPDPPVLVTPGDDGEFAATDVQAFTINATDPDGDAYVGRVFVTRGGEAVTDFPTSPADSGEDASGVPPTPLEPGEYHWTASATDVRGAEGGVSAEGSFSVAALPENTGPVATLVSPADGHEFGFDDNQVFTASAEDAEDDDWVGHVTVTSPETGAIAATFTVGPADSGEEASGSPPTALDPGDYEWSVTPVDSRGAPGSTSETRQFSVAAAPPNEPPAVTLVSPDDGHTFGRDEGQVFRVGVTDPEGDPSEVSVVVDGEVVCESPVTLPGEEASCVAAPPVAPGAHSWSAFATDIRGAQGVQAPARAFAVSDNARPDVPELVSPNDGGGFERDEPQVFTVSYSDPDGDAGSVEVFVDAEVVCRTAPVPSGATSSCTAVPPVEPGTYSWTARSVDVHGAESDFAPARLLTVGANRAPAPPVLVTPGEGGEFAATDVQVFTINATDPDGDAYVGRVVVTRGGDAVTDFPTSPADSGEDASGVPPTPIEPGEYRWAASATDVRGAEGGVSAEGSFSVLALPENSGPVAALVAPGDGHEFAVGDDQVFTVSAEDAQDDDWVGHVTVTSPGSGDIVSTFVIGPAASGDSASAGPPVALDPGDYEWSATATDTRGAPGPTSESRSFAVVPEPPTVTLVSPADGHTFGRDEPQAFTVRPADPQGDPSKVTVLVDGEPACETPVALSGEESSCVAAPPLDPGDHTWSAYATDLRGAQGAQAPARAFSVSDNARPDAPELVSPNEGGGFEREEPQVFSVSYADPDGDAGSVEVFVDSEVVCRTAPVPSGATSSCTAAPPVEPGTYSWTARSTDAGGLESDFAPARVFTVGGNRAPDPPVPVAPADGHVFGAGEAQVFTINATDPDGDAYIGRVFVTRDGEAVTDFPTSPADSGEDASGVPPTPLEPGEYRWTASATDVRGAEGGVSAEGSFTVLALPENSGPVAALVSPADGHEFGFDDDQVFTASALDAEDDDWVGHVTVTSPETGAIAATFTVGPAASGEQASESPPVALDPGDYEWSVTAVDTRGAPGPTSETRQFSVAAPPPTPAVVGVDTEDMSPCTVGLVTDPIFEIRHSSLGTQPRSVCLIWKWPVEAQFRLFIDPDAVP